MDAITESSYVGLFLGLFTPISILIYTYLASTNNYWKRRGIPYVKPSLFFGNIKEAVLGKKNAMYVHRELYNDLNGERFGGYFELLSPCLLVRDPKLIERILIKDFSHFMDRGFGNLDRENDPISANLFYLNGSQWKFMRHKLTSIFTSVKLADVFQNMYASCKESVAKLESYQKKVQSLDANTTISMVTSDAIAKWAYGLQFKSVIERDQFRKMVYKVAKPSKKQALRFFAYTSFERTARFFKLKRYNATASDYFLNLAKTTIDYHEKNYTLNKNFVHLLVELKEQDKTGETVDFSQELGKEDAYLKQGIYNLSENDQNTLELTDDVLAAQAFPFLSVGLESTSATISYALFCLAANPEVQQKAWQEVVKMDAWKNGLPYSIAIKLMTYLDQVIQEVLRIYPTLPVLNRVVTSPYKLPGTDITLQKGQRISIPVYGIHMDPSIYQEPEKFDPERFKDNNYKSSSKYMPFGDGPRTCIAMRLALWEIKTHLVKILFYYSISLSNKTQTPLEFDPANSFSTRPKGGIWLCFRRRPGVSEPEGFSLCSV